MNNKNVVTISSASIIKTILIVVVAFLLFYLRDIILIILTAVVIATAIEPAAEFFVRRKMPRTLAVVCIYAIILILIAGFFYLILPYILSELASFMSMLPHYITALDDKTKGDISANFLGWNAVVQSLSQSNSLGEVVQNVATNITTGSGSLWIALTSVFGGAISFGLTFIIAFYLSVQDKGVEEFLKLIIPLARERYIISLWHRTQHKIGRWIQGQLILALMIGVLVFLGLTILGVKNALFLAFISTVFEVIPVFGPFIGSVPGVLVAVVQGGMTYGILVAAMYLIVQQIESNVIYPLVIKKILDIPPLVVIIALVVGAQVGGFLGIILSVPLAVAITEIMQDIRRHRIAARAEYSNTNE